MLPRGQGQGSIWGFPSPPDAQSVCPNSHRFYCMKSPFVIQYLPMSPRHVSAFDTKPPTLSWGFLQRCVCVFCLESFSGSQHLHNSIRSSGKAFHTLPCLLLPTLPSLRHLPQCDALTSPPLPPSNTVLCLECLFHFPSGRLHLSFQ